MGIYKNILLQKKKNIFLKSILKYAFVYKNVPWLNPLHDTQNNKPTKATSSIFVQEGWGGGGIKTL